MEKIEGEPATGGAKVENAVYVVNPTGPARLPRGDRYRAGPPVAIGPAILPDGVHFTRR